MPSIFTTAVWPRNMLTRYISFTNDLCWLMPLVAGFTAEKRLLDSISVRKRNKKYSSLLDRICLPVYLSLIYPCSRSAMYPSPLRCFRPLSADFGRLLTRNSRIRSLTDSSEHFEAGKKEVREPRPLFMPPPLEERTANGDPRGETPFALDSRSVIPSHPDVSC